MSGLDDTAEPAAQDAGPAQDQDETGENTAATDAPVGDTGDAAEDPPPSTAAEAAAEVASEPSDAGHAASEPSTSQLSGVHGAGPPTESVAQESVATESVPAEPVASAEPVAQEAAPSPEPAPVAQESAASEPEPVESVSSAEPVAQESAPTESVSPPPSPTEPVAEQSTPSEPASPEPVAPEPAPAAPASAATASLQPTQPEQAAQSESTQPEHTQQAPQSEQAQPEQAPQPESTQPQHTQPESAQPDPKQPEKAPTPTGPPAEAPQIGSTVDAAGVVRPPATPPRPKAVTDTGKIVEGLVTAVSADLVELTLDDGRKAVIHGRNFSLTDEVPSAVLSVGDRAFGAELAREDPKSRVVLSRAWALKRQAWERVVDASENNQLLQGRVVSASKKGLVVDVGVRGFVPLSHLELNPVSDLSPYVDQTLELKILEVDPRREKLVLSRRSLLLKAQRKETQELLNSLKPGEIRTGKVASLADYGAFVDLGGVSGLVHISELSWQRVSKPSKVVAVGDEVQVKILDVKPKKKRISLSIRQITADPLSTIEVGAVVTGSVTRLVDFGAFVSIGEFEGLVHLSELAEYRVSTPEEIVAPGDQVGVKILSVDTKRRRIELSIRRAAEYGG